MKLHLVILLLLLLGFTAGLSAPPEKKFDFNLPESPRKPFPEWLKVEKGKQVFIDQGKNDPRLKGLLTPEGVKVEIVADFPTVVNPVGMTFSEDGTPFVLEWVHGGDNWHEVAEEFTYKDGSKRKVATMRKEQRVGDKNVIIKDVVKVLQFNEEKKAYDQAQVVLEDELPSSILLHDGWMYLSSRGTVRRYRQSQSGGPYDVKQVIAQGFCGFHHHQVSGLTLGNDGWLYITAGDDDNYVEGSDGSRATVLRTGAVFRCRPDGSQMQAYSMGYRNPYRDIAFDTAFNAFHADNDNEDGSKFTGCRLMHVAEESDFGWRLRQGARCCQPDPVRGAVYGELPGKVPPMLKTGRGAPAGLLIYNDTRFPEPYRGLLYYPDVFRKLVRAYRVAPLGATFAVIEEFEFMKSDDPLFRPCQMVSGPDGAMYVVDWRTDSGGAGQLSGDGKHGRIYRVTWAGTEDQPALPPRGLDSWDMVRRQSDAGLLKELASQNFSDRQVAQRELVRRGPRNLPALLTILDNSDAPLPARLASLGAVQSFWNDDVKSSFIARLRDGDPDVRRLAADGLSLNCKADDRDAGNALLKALSDPDPAARRAIVLAMGRVGGDGAADALVNTLKFDIEKDPWLRDGIIRAIERSGKAGIEALMALAESGVDKDRDLVLDVFRTLRSRAAAEAIPKLLAYPHDTPIQRAQLILSYNNYLFDPPVSLKPLEDYLTGKEEPPLLVRLAGVEVLSAGGQLKGDKAETLLLNCLAQANPAQRVELIKIVEASRVTKAAPVLAKLLGDEKLNLADRAIIVKALRNLNDKTALPALKKIVADNGNDSPETVQLRLEALRTLVALDGKAGQEAAQAFLDEKEPKLQGVAVEVLSTQADGARALAERFLAKKLPREMLPQVSDALRTHSGKHPELNKLLTEVMKGGLLLSLDKAEIERVEKLVKSRGDAKRGKNLFLNGKTLACINCHRLEGVGGNVGPDLTRVWETQSIEKLMEKMIEPSKVVKEGYQTWIATTKKGQVFKGLKVSQSAEAVVLREANGQEIRIAAADVDELTATKQSLMPDNVISQLKFDQFLDVVAFLKDRPAQESLRGMALEFWVVGPFAGEPDMEHPPEMKPSLDAKYPGLKAGEELTWQPRQTEPSGLLNLRALFNRDQTAAYAQTYVYSPKAQKVQMLIGASDTLKVWMNGAVVHEHAERRPARPDEDKVEVELKEGWNPVLVKVVGAGADHGLYLRFTGANDLRLALKPEGK